MSYFYCFSLNVSFSVMYRPDCGQSWPMFAHSLIHESWTNRLKSKRSTVATTRFHFKTIIWSSYEGRWGFWSIGTHVQTLEIIDFPTDNNWANCSFSPVTSGQVWMNSTIFRQLGFHLVIASRTVRTELSSWARCQHGKHWQDEKSMISNF